MRRNIKIALALSGGTSVYVYTQRRSKTSTKKYSHSDRLMDHTPVHSRLYQHEISSIYNTSAIVKYIQTFQLFIKQPEYIDDEKHLSGCFNNIIKTILDWKKYNLIMKELAQLTESDLQVHNNNEEIPNKYTLQTTKLVNTFSNKLASKFNLQPSSVSLLSDSKLHSDITGSYNNKPISWYQFDKYIKSLEFNIISQILEPNYHNKNINKAIGNILSFIHLLNMNENCFTSSESSSISKQKKTYPLNLNTVSNISDHSLNDMFSSWNTKPLNERNGETWQNALASMLYIRQAVKHKLYLDAYFELLKLYEEYNEITELKEIVFTLENTLKAEQYSKLQLAESASIRSDFMDLKMSIRTIAEGIGILV